MLIIVSVASSVLTVVGIVDYFMAPLHENRRRATLATRRAVRRQEENEQRETQRAQVIARLDHLSREEIRVVADSLRNDSPTFYTHMHSPPVAMLVGKGVVWTTGTTHHREHYPFSFYDFVWEKLVERKDEFLAKDDEHTRAEAAERAATARRSR